MRTRDLNVVVVWLNQLPCSPWHLALEMVGRKDRGLMWSRRQCLSSTRRGPPHRCPLCSLFTCWGTALRREPRLQDETVNISLEAHGVTGKAVDVELGLTTRSSFFNVVALTFSQLRGRACGVWLHTKQVDEEMLHVYGCCWTVAALFRVRMPMRHAGERVLSVQDLSRRRLRKRTEVSL